MEDLALQTSKEVNRSASEPPWLAQPCQGVAEWRTDVAQLRRESLRLRHQAGCWRGMQAAAEQPIAALEYEVAQPRGEDRELQAELFGRQSESSSPTDRSHHPDEPDAAARPRPRGQRHDRPGPKRRDYRHRPAREELQQQPPTQRICPTRGRPLTICGAEVSEQVEIETHVDRRVILRRRYPRACRPPGPRTVTAPVVPKLIPEGRSGVSVRVGILLDKFAAQRPTERRLQSWRRLGLDLSAGTVAAGLHRSESLLRGPYDALVARDRQSAYHQADETRWLVFVTKDGKIGHGRWLRVFGGADTVVYVLDPSRSHTVPEAHFPDDARGVLNAMERRWRPPALGRENLTDRDRSGVAGSPRCRWRSWPRWKCGGSIRDRG